MLRNEARWNDGGEEEKKEETDEKQQVRCEEGAAQVPLVGEEVRFKAKWCAESSQESNEKISIAFIPFVPLCNGSSNDGVGDEENKGGDDGVELEEGGDQGETHHSHRGVGCDKEHAL